MEQKKHYPKRGKKEFKKDFKKEIRTKFEVVSEIREPFYDFDSLIETCHWSDERKSRHQKIVDELGKGDFISTFVVETGHKNGRELHNIFTNGLILIQNERTGFLVTELIARPQQLKRYWEDLGKGVPIEVWKMMGDARYNQKKGRNNW